MSGSAVDSFANTKLISLILLLVGIKISTLKNALLALVAIFGICSYIT